MKISLKDKHLIVSTRNKLRYSYKKSVPVNIKGRRTMKVTYKSIFDKPNRYTYKFPIGYSFFMVNELKDEASREDIDAIKNYFKSNIEGFDYMHLRDYQKEDLSKLLKYKRGVFQCYTGYGKSECIAVMVKNYIKMGLKVLVIAPSNPAVKELKLRLNGLGVETTTTWREGNQLNVINPKALLVSKKWDNSIKYNHKFLRSVDILIADEVEMTLNDSFYKMNKVMDKCEYYYGFSASANKRTTTAIPRTHSLLSMLNSQLHSLVSIYGFTAVYQLPTINKLTIHTLNTDLSAYKYFKVSESHSDYAALVTNLMHYQGFMNAVKWILDKVDNLFLPINNLDVINSFVKGNLTDRMIMVIRGNGNHLYQNGKRIKSIDLSEVKRMIANKECHFIMGTSSSFRALDFKNLNNILCTFGKLTSVCIQYVGRVARDINMNIWYIDSTPRIKIYSKTIEDNLKMIERFYQNCDTDYREHYIDDESL